MLAGSVGTAYLLVSLDGERWWPHPQLLPDLLQLL